MSRGIIQPKPGSYFRIGETVYKAFDEGGRFGCDRCVFNRSGYLRCAAPHNLNCGGLYFDDHTHNLKDVELVEEASYSWMAWAVPAVIWVGAIIYIMVN